MLVVGMAFLMVIGVILGPVLLRVAADSTRQHHRHVVTPISQ